MSSIQNPCAKKYSTITLESRKNLIQLVLAQHFSISKAANILGLKLSTAKLIVKKYKETGVFFQKKEDRQKRQKGGQDGAQQNRNDLANNLEVQQTGSIQNTQNPLPAFLNPIAGHFFPPNIQVPYYVFNYYPTPMFWI